MEGSACLGVALRQGAVTYPVTKQAGSVAWARSLVG